MNQLPEELIMHALEKGWIEPNDVRRLLGLPPVPAETMTTMIQLAEARAANRSVMSLQAKMFKNRAGNEKQRADEQG